MYRSLSVRQNNPRRGIGGDGNRVKFKISAAKRVALALQALPRLSFIRPSAPSSKYMRSHLYSIALAPPV